MLLLCKFDSKKSKKKILTGDCVHLRGLSDREARALSGARGAKRQTSARSANARATPGWPASLFNKIPLYYIKRYLFNKYLLKRYLFLIKNRSLLALTRSVRNYWGIRWTASSMALNGIITSYPRSAGQWRSDFHLTTYIPQADTIRYFLHYITSERLRIFLSHQFEREKK